MLRRAWLSLASAAAALAQEKPPAEKDISADELKELLEKKIKLFYLDVREPKELEELGTIECYVNIPLSQLEARINEIPKDVHIAAT
jgi:rhodanese-related sulfurtransferase